MKFVFLKFNMDIANLKGTIRIDLLCLYVFFEKTFIYNQTK